PKRVQAFLDWAAGQQTLAGVVLRVSPAREALAGADLVATATTSATPVFHAEWLEAGVHITAVGAFQPDKRELDERTMRNARIVVDEREAAFAEAGELQGLRPEDTAELGEVLDGRATGRVDDTQRTVFKSVGNAVQDLVVSARVYEAATKGGFGQEVADLS
ncbi:MAG: ornithine cyclodeaminase family protein, partial [Chloroflexi bacterium]|nr:ornithine cyclodeaminase family protein [Chloroflexota bacterium]